MTRFIFSKRYEEFYSEFQSIVLQIPNMSTILTCPICLYIFSDARFLPCGHGFCRECIQEAFETNRQCPVCRESVPRGESNLKQIFAVNEAVEGIQSITAEKNQEITRVTNERDTAQGENDVLLVENSELLKEVSVLKRKLEVSENRVRHLRNKRNELVKIKKQYGKLRTEVLKLEAVVTDALKDNDSEDE